MIEHIQKPLLIVACGPTATGKSDYAVQLALKHNGEVISADSRQVYKGFDLSSGKITTAEMQGAAHHMLDIASPLRTYTVAQFQKKAQHIIKDILKRGKVPILCGGTGLYIDAVVYNTTFPKVSADTALRKNLSQLDAPTLAAQLTTLDPERAATIDTHNKVRLIRAIEIAIVLGKVPHIDTANRQSQYDVQWHYLDFPDDILKERIHRRLLARIEAGMIDEIATLHASKNSRNEDIAKQSSGQSFSQRGISWKRLESFGLEFRYTSLYLQEKITLDEMITQLEQAIWQYVKRQRTWCKKYTNL